MDKYRKLADTNPAAYLPDVAMTLNNLGLLEISNKEYTNACAHLHEALEIREKLALENPAAFDLDLCQSILAMIVLYGESPGTCTPGETEITALVLRAHQILKKYPEDPQAQNMLKIVEQLAPIIKKN